MLLDAPLYPQPLPLFIHVLRSPVGTLATRLLPTTWQVTHVLRRTYHDASAIAPGVVETYAASLRQPGARPALVATARALVPEHDDYLRPDEARARFARVPQAHVIGVDGAKHLWVGEKSVRTVLDHVTGCVNPARAPLPDHWDGPMDRWSDL